ncbi:MAG: histidinol dehydrogenase [Candidatus Aquicultor primus]|uniref:Histidinol dehydrogenase n=1 Tax=Candidatus Aquicultor primus TaxID=1797195 RepID=A0A1F2UPW3_9ACTN|nr:MAG: histidinol dehydrogenase [Candidatus Aquicultor primus]HCH00093.1 histidinol dehydrogenase [Actinomycetota bacterium]
MMKQIELKMGFDQFDARKLLAKPLFERPDVEATVRDIIETVTRDGDKALFAYTEKFDKISLTPETVRVSAEEFDAAYSLVESEFLGAIKEAKERITAFHKRQKQNSWFTVENGVFLGQLVRPVERAGIYVPGGRAAYPSSVLMNAIPAKVAGVDEIAMVVPGAIRAEVLVAAAEVGVDEVYKVGGAQAIAALAFGTESVKKVDVIAGPGNIYVTLAKKMVVGSVNIDMLAGPSEVVVVADANAKPAYIAADLLAQAEHDPDASSILITDSQTLAQKVVEALEIQLARLERKDIATKSLTENGRIFLVASREEAIRLSNIIAPEHLELMIDNPLEALGMVRNAGAIFLGAYTPEAVGDYVAGPNHVLPTGGTARFYSPLSVDTFIKKSSVLSFSKQSLGMVADAAVTIATGEGLGAHAKSIEYRMEE